MFMQALKRLGVEASLVGLEPTTEAEFNTAKSSGKLVAAAGHEIPTWAAIQAEILNDTSIADKAVWLIDQIADEVYTASSSRATRYERKFEEATAYKSAGYPASPSDTEYPFLVREASERGITEQALADLIIDRANEFSSFGADIETLRVKLTNDINAASTVAAKRTAAEAIITTAKTKADALLNS